MLIIPGIPSALGPNLNSGYVNDPPPTSKRRLLRRDWLSPRPNALFCQSVASSSSNG